MNNVEEKMVYQKLFNIHYNNKEFTIFIDQYGRKTFLEVDSRGEYIYPLISDFIELHKIYNERDIFTCYYYNIGENLNKYKNKKVVFKEYVRNTIEATTASLIPILAAVILANAYTATTVSRMIKLEQDDNGIRLACGYVDGSIIENTSELDHILGYNSVSTEEVIRAINANDNMDEFHKKCAINLATFIKNKYPNTDARIFYENMKSVTVVEKTGEKIGKNIAGTYNSYDNIVSLREGYTENEEVTTHEFAHSYHHWKEQSLITPKYRIEDFGHSLDEAMTNKVIDGLVGATTYNQEMKVLNYFLTCVDFDYYDYEQEGVTKLITLLKEKYYNIDIDYIINTIDTILESNTYLDENIKIEDNQELLDEMFSICISNIDQNSLNPYQSLIDFLKLIDYEYKPEVASHYLEEYNAILQDLGYDKNQTMDYVETFYRTINVHESLVESLKFQISELDISSLPKNDPYQPFKKFLNRLVPSFPNYYITNEEMHQFMCTMLDIYNDALYRNGFTRDDTITSEDMTKRVERFKNIKILGYAVTNEDKLYPIIDMKNADKVYDTENKIPVLNDQAHVILLDKDAIRGENLDYTNSYQYNFINNLFQNVDHEISQYDEEYWQDIFNIKKYQYSKIPISLDGTEISEEYLNDFLLKTYVTIGQREDGTKTFTLGTTDELKQNDDLYLVNLLEKDIDDYMNRECNLTPEEGLELNQYLDDYYLKTKTVLIPLAKYIDGYVQCEDEISSIDLNQFFNDHYLTKEVADSSLSTPISSRYPNFTYDSNHDTVNIHPVYHVIINTEDKEINMNMNSISLYLNPNENYLHIYEQKNVDDIIKPDGETSAKVYLETVLDYYGILKEDKPTYYLDEPEILELYSNYVHDVYTNRESKKNSVAVAVSSKR